MDDLESVELNSIEQRFSAFQRRYPPDLGYGIHVEASFLFLEPLLRLYEKAIELNRDPKDFGLENLIHTQRIRIKRQLVKGDQVIAEGVAIAASDLSDDMNIADGIAISRMISVLGFRHDGDLGADPSQTGASLPEGTPIDGEAPVALTVVQEYPDTGSGFSSRSSSESGNGEVISEDKADDSRNLDPSIPMSLQRQIIDRANKLEKGIPELNSCEAALTWLRDNAA